MSFLLNICIEEPISQSKFHQPHIQEGSIIPFNMAKFWQLVTDGFIVVFLSSCKPFLVQQLVFFQK